MLPSESDEIYESLSENKSCYNQTINCFVRPESEEEDSVKALAFVFGLLLLLFCLAPLFLVCLCFCIGERITLWGEGTSREKEEDGMGPT